MSTMSTTIESYDERGSGWLGFAAIIMFAVGFFRIIEAIAFFANSHRINNLTGGLFGGQGWAWGLWDLIIAAAAILAGMSILSGGVYGRVIGYLWAVLVIVQGFTVINLAPWYGAISIVVAVLVIYGLASTPREPAAP
jgi:hypothetical protein